MEIIILPLPCSLLLKSLLASINLLKVSTSQKYQEQSKLESVATRDIKKKKYVSSCILLVTFFERLNTRRWLRLDERVKMYTLYPQLAVFYWLWGNNRRGRRREEPNTHTRAAEFSELLNCAYLSHCTVVRSSRDDERDENSCQYATLSLCIEYRS